MPPEINVISNIVENGKKIGQLGAEEAKWHTDTGFVEKPPAGSFLHAKELPPEGEGANTSFLNLYDAYEALPDDLRKKVEDRWSKRPLLYQRWGFKEGFQSLQRSLDGPRTLSPTRKRTSGDRTQSTLSWTAVQFLRPRSTVEDSEELLDCLWAHATQDRFLYEHVWSLGDVLIWDNRCVMHRQEAFKRK